MALVMEGTGLGRSASGDPGDLAATVLVLDGHPRYWRASGLACDRDVSCWQVYALDAAHPDYASLSYGELGALRARHPWP